MIVIRSILFSAVFLLFCSVGVLATEPSTSQEPKQTTPPSYYINQEGGISSTQGLDLIAIPTGIKPEEEQNDDNQDKSIILTPSTPGTWYWAGQDDSGNLSVDNVSIGSEAGTVNIIVGPNGSLNNVAVTFDKSSWSIGKDQIVNIFGAADASTLEANKIALNQCYLTVNSGETETAGISVSDNGQLNVYSAALNGVGNSTAGLAMSGGTVLVGKNGQLQCSNSTNQATAVQNATGLSITGGTLTNNGYLRIIQNTSTAGNYTSASISNSTPASLVMNGGTVFCSNVYPGTNNTLATLNSGVWLQQSTSVVSTTPGPDTAEPSPPAAKEGTVSNLNFVSGNVFGGTSTNPVILNLGVNNQLTCLSGNTFTVESGANLVIPDNYDVVFGNSNAQTASNSANGTLNIQKGGTLTIGAEANVTLYADSQLTNNGNIVVDTDN